MGVRTKSPFHSKRYIGNKFTKEVHDVYMERFAFCKIDKIKYEHIVTFTPDTLEQAHHEGYKNCRYCLANSQREKY